MDWSEMNCGVAEHSDDCLCDVVITEPVSIGIKDAVDEMHMGKQLCEIRNYGRPWSTNQMLDNFAHQRMVELLKERVDNKEIRRIILEEYGVDYSRSTVSHTKRRIGLSTPKYNV
jgi:nicotinic acid mononucleotide adenylyltransferase